MSAIDDYFAALNRLKADKPQRLPKGSAINKDTIALEAGRKRGSIKKSRAEHANLIAAIDEAAQQVGQNEITPNQQIAKAKAKSAKVKSDYEQLQADYEKLLEKFNSLLLENFELRQKSDC